MIDMIDTAIDVTCPSCFALEGEPCSPWCDDNYVGTVRAHKNHARWDDED